MSPRVKKMSVFVLASGVACMILLLTYFIWLYTNKTIQEGLQNEFTRQTEDIEISLTQRVQAYTNVLYNVQGLFAVQPFFDRPTWDNFLETSQFGQYPDINHLTYTIIVPDSQKQAFIDKIRADRSVRPQGLPNFTIYPEGKRDSYAVVVFVWPVDDDSLRTSGYDLFTSPARKIVIENARDMNIPVASEKVIIVVDQAPGFIFSAPLYKPNMPLTTVEQRRAAIAGYVSGVFNLRTLFEKALNSPNHKDIAFALYDTTGDASFSAETLLDTNDNGKYSTSSAYTTPYKTIEHISIGTRTWTLKMVAKPSFGGDFPYMVMPWVVGAGGILLSILLFTIIYLQGRSAERQVELEKARDEAILFSIGEGLFVIDTTGKVILVNRAFEEMTGIKQSQIVGKSFVSQIRAEDASGNLIPDEKRPVVKTLREGKEIQSTNGDFYIVRTDHTRFPIAFKTSLVSMNNKMIGVLGIFRDITRELEVDKAKTEFVSIASHQLRTPLGIEKWYLEILKGDSYLKKAPRQIATYFHEVTRNNERVLALVRDLLSVSRIDQGSVKNNPTEVKVSALLRIVVRRMRIIAHPKKVTITLHDKVKELTFYIDGMRLEEVFENIIANAVDYNKPGGSVDITVTIEKNTLNIAVTDTGIGISTDDQKKLFTKFFRSAEGTTHKAEGTGLGLYVTKAYLKEWGGDISVTSTVGQGSTFTVGLPLSLQKRGGETS